MENIIKLHVLLNQIYQLSKNLHWFTKNYSDHLLYDRIAGGVLDDDDALVELFLMDEEFIAMPIPAGVYKETSSKKGLRATLDSTLEEAINQCSKAKTSNILGAAGSLLDGIQEHLVVKRNLLQQVVEIA